MADKPFEHWEHELLKQVDEKIEPIRSSILNLKRNQDKALTELEGRLLRTQRYVARLAIQYGAEQCVSAVKRERPKMVDDFFTQIRVDSASAIARIGTSNDPIAIVGEFNDKWYPYLQRIGIRIVLITP